MPFPEHKPADIRSDILKRLRDWRWRLLWQRLLLTAATVSIVVLVSLLMNKSSSEIVQYAIAVVVLMLGQLPMSHQWRQLSTDKFLQHLNRRFSDFEESAQLLLRESDELTAMQSLQRQRARTVYKASLAQLEHWQPALRYRQTLVTILIVGLLSLLAPELRTLSQNLYESFSAATLSIGAANDDDPGGVRIEQIDVHIQAPAYTGLAANQVNTLDLEVPEGSQVQWTLSFSAAADSYYLDLSDGHRITLLQSADGRWQANATIKQTDLYRITRIEAGRETTIGDIYSLTVIPDQAPVIRITQPVSPVLEIPKSGPARFTGMALINDDYAVETVIILASVAKGSGEGVKFRDQELTFQSNSETSKGRLYQRQWDLQALGMEPGDELYFTVLATDNRQPQANTGRSETVIVRWLEDGQSGLAGEGLAIDFIPEFFSSQRQIIIDTEQLLEDRQSLELQSFKDTSYEIGQAQADLKQKYGQYLGDEFGEGPGEQLGIMHEIAEAKTAGDNTDANAADDGHEHEESTSINSRMNSTAEILELFGHNHGDPEIGPITKRNPVALMKRAVNEMWQAEKHLMQAEPQQALPFEYEAYKYLKLARQADRIYVKRLGFEPPPVTEENRLSGELDEILSYRQNETFRQQDLGASATEQLLLRGSYQLLSMLRQGVALNIQQQSLLRQLSTHLKTASHQRPALIRQAASVEKLLISDDSRIEACENCIDELKNTLWRLMDAGDAGIQSGNSSFLPADELIRSYQAELGKLPVVSQEPL